MTIQLKPEQENRIAEALRSGAYSSPDEVIDQALEMLQDRDEWLTEHRVEIAEKIEAGYAAAKRGELIDEDQVRANMEKRKRAWLADQRQE